MFDFKLTNTKEYLNRDALVTEYRFNLVIEKVSQIGNFIYENTNFKIYLHNQNDFDDIYELFMFKHIEDAICAVIYGGDYSKASEETMETENLLTDDKTLFKIWTTEIIQEMLEAATK